jgi:hypothetical protein
LFFVRLLREPQFERNLINERTLAGLEAARARGRKGGRPKLKSTGGKVAMAKKLYRDRTLSIPEICKTLNISKATLYSRWHEIRNVCHHGDFAHPPRACTLNFSEHSWTFPAIPGFAPRP